MAFTVRHGLSDYALKDLLELVNCHLPYAQHISKYLFLKKFTPLVTITPHFYCSECKNNISKFQNIIFALRTVKMRCNRN